ncbi:MAG: acyl carrier protein [Phycisphaerae bacterium]|nr:acyl carrier protein [Phycisphaerae bacterium]
MATMTQEEIFDKVKTTLVDALSVDDEEVTESAKLQADLGAESIDFLDIAFRLEKLFNIKIPQDELFPQQIISNPAYVENRKLNAAGLAALKAAMPHADLSQFEKNPEIDKLGDVFTVGTIVRYLQTKIAR